MIWTYSHERKNSQTQTRHQSDVIVPRRDAGIDVKGGDVSWKRLEIEADIAG